MPNYILFINYMRVVEIRRQIKTNYIGLAGK